MQARGKDDGIVLQHDSSPFPPPGEGREEMDTVSWLVGRDRHVGGGDLLRSRAGALLAAPVPAVVRVVVVVRVVAMIAVVPVIAVVTVVPVVAVVTVVAMIA